MITSREVSGTVVALSYEPVIWSAPAERSGDGAFDFFDHSVKAVISKAVSPLRFATALQKERA